MVRAVFFDDVQPDCAVVEALEAALPGLDRRAVAAALAAELILNCAPDRSGEDRELRRIASRDGGNMLESLVLAGAVAPVDVLRIGLLILSALSRLCQTDSASILRPAA